MNIQKNLPEVMFLECHFKTTALSENRLGTLQRKSRRKRDLRTDLSINFF